MLVMLRHCSVSHPIDLGLVNELSQGKVPVFNFKGKLIPYTRLKHYFDYTEPHYCSYMESWLNVHENQYHAGLEIVEYFQVGINRVVLMAEMQSGKTGTTRYVVHVLQRLSPPTGWDDKKFIPDNIFFICGMNDNDLRNQAISEFEGLIPEDNIMFSKQLQKYNHGQGRKGITPSLVIIDESHYASFHNSQVDRFMKSITHENLLVLSVSATAMAELAGTESPYCKSIKGRVYLQPGPGYYGIKDLFYDGLIKQAVNITDDTSYKLQRDANSFIDLVCSEYDYQRDHDDLKFNIIRLPNQYYYKDLEDYLIKLDMNISFINHHTCSSMTISDFNDYTEEPPKCFTIIWIYGSLRAGKQLQTNNIGFVHDTAVSGPDVVAQSLLGRILGYNKCHNKVRCYTDVKSAKLMLEWINSAYDTMKIPAGSKGIVGGFTEKIGDSCWEKHVPLMVKMDSDMRSYYRAKKQQNGNRYPYKDELFGDLVLTATDSRSKIINILENYKPGSCGGLMVLTENNAKKSFSDHWTNNYSSYLNNTLVHCCNVENHKSGNYFYVYVNLNINSSSYGMALITYKEHISTGGEAKAAVQVKTTSRYHPNWN